MTIPTALILISVAASLWCLGLWAITEPGKVLDFLKQPLLKFIHVGDISYKAQRDEVIEKYQNLQLNSESDEKRNQYRDQMKKEIKSIDKEHRKFKAYMKVLNPIILCPVCMGSLHGLLAIYMCGLPVDLWCIPVMVITSGLNKIWHEKIF